MNTKYIIGHCDFLQIIYNVFSEDGYEDHRVYAVNSGSAGINLQ